MTLNPYQPPSIESSAPTRPHITRTPPFVGTPPWRDGDRMVVLASNPEFLKICPVTGESENLVKIRARIWRPKGAFWTRGLFCELHVTRRAAWYLRVKQWVDAFLGLMGAIGIFSFAALFINPREELILTTLASMPLLLIGSFLRAAILDPFLWVESSAFDYEWIRGAHPGYLDHLPGLHEIQPTGVPEAWRDGKRLVMAENEELPKICLMSGSVEDLIPTYIVPPSSFFRFSLVTLSNPFLKIYFSKRWLRERWTDLRGSMQIGRIVGATLVTLGILFVPILGCMGAVLIVPGVLIVFREMIRRDDALPVLTIAKVRNGYIWLNGAHPDFLAKLPPWVH